MDTVSAEIRQACLDRRSHVGHIPCNTSKQLTVGMHKGVHAQNSLTVNTQACIAKPSIETVALPALGCLRNGVQAQEGAHTAVYASTACTWATKTWSIGQLMCNVKLVARHPGGNMRWLTQESSLQSCCRTVGSWSAQNMRWHGRCACAAAALCQSRVQRTHLRRFPDKPNLLQQSNASSVASVDAKG